jgi:hypothetical protein
MSFYGTASGQPELAFLADFTTIPNRTKALAKINKFEIIEKSSEYTGPQKFMQITWEVISEQFKGHQVTQKIKVFDGTPTQLDRNLNMLVLVMRLCNYTPQHTQAPSNQELLQMHGKVCGIKIQEWSMPKNDGSGMMEGNYVSEVYASANFLPELGVKSEYKYNDKLNSALNRNANLKVGQTFSEDDIPF